LVYGGDDRRDFYELDDAQKEWLEATSRAMVARSAVRIADGKVVLDGPSTRQAENLCPEEPFGDDPSVAFCSATLVEPDLLLTAGHCLYAHDCESMAIVRGFHKDAADAVHEVGPDDLRFCERVTSWNPGSDVEEPADFAWIVLDRADAAGERIDFGDGASLERGAAMATAGYGQGGPLRWSSGSVTASPSERHGRFATNLDAFKGLSGAAVWDDRRQVVGVFDRGAPDLAFDEEHGCNRVSVVPEDLGAEESTLVTRALDALCRDAPERPTCRARTAASLEAGGGCSVSAHERFDLGWLLVLAVWIERRTSARRR
jgi:hypothetical protein